jgi:hypothetical protein
MSSARKMFCANLPLCLHCPPWRSTDYKIGSYFFFARPWPLLWIWGKISKNRTPWPVAELCQAWQMGVIANGKKNEWCVILNLCELVYLTEVSHKNPAPPSSVSWLQWNLLWICVGQGKAE